MKKFLVTVAVILVVGYVAVGIAAWRLLPAKIAEADKKRPAVTMAIARIVNDQLLVSRQITEITGRTLGKGKAKVDQVSAILEDQELNRLAVTYLGSDWSGIRSAFLGNVLHSRELLRMQKEERKGYESKLNAKIRELEHKKKMLLEQAAPEPGKGMSLRQWELKLHDVDRQLAMYRSSNTYMEYLKKDQNADNEIVAKAKNEEMLFKLANDCEAQTVVRLNQVLAEQVSQLRFEEAEPERMRHQMSYFNIWPLNKISAMSLPTN